jgi:UDP-N-acetylmuramoylalanine--D-glutamate ligase
MEVAGKKILVIGAGRSGTASARFLAERGARVALNDRKPVEEWNAEAIALREIGIGLVGGDAPSWLLDQIEIVVLSPGVPVKMIPVRYAERAGAQVIGEIELASRFLKGRVVGITGSNGKTTTTTLAGEIMKDAGFHTLVGGNIGTPLVSLVAESREDTWTVAELSSFQLETINEFRPSIAAVLNITPDHMDRYDTIEDYAAAKHRIFRNQTKADTAILNADDQIVSSWARGLRARVIRFSVRQEVEEGLFLRGEEIIARFGGEEKMLMKRDDILLPGLHNVENVLATLSIGLAANASPDSMRETVKRFRGVEHRLELVAEINGVVFYNDSKATNVDAAVKALEAIATTLKEDARIVLIIGGRGKNSPYAPLAPLVASHVRALVTIGEDAERIERELSVYAPAARAETMSDAVRLAREKARTGDRVLLAPACASFDMFDNFEHRGREYKKAVMSDE